jgi:hypothetical protein
MGKTKVSCKITMITVQKKPSKKTIDELELPKDEEYEEQEEHRKVSKSKKRKVYELITPSQESYRKKSGKVSTSAIDNSTLEATHIKKKTASSSIETAINHYNKILKAKASIDEDHILGIGSGSKVLISKLEDKIDEDIIEAISTSNKTDKGVVYWQWINILDDILDTIPAKASEATWIQRVYSKLIIFPLMFNHVVEEHVFIIVNSYFFCREFTIPIPSVRNQYRRSFQRYIKVKSCVRPDAAMLDEKNRLRMAIEWEAENNIEYGFNQIVFHSTVALENQAVQRLGTPPVLVLAMSGKEFRLGVVEREKAGEYRYQVLGDLNLSKDLSKIIKLFWNYHQTVFLTSLVKINICEIKLILFREICFFIF